MAVVAFAFVGCKDDKEEDSKENDKTPAGVEAVDLGLPSGTKWANMNVGASKPEDGGLYFAWGETVGYTTDVTDGRKFDWESYKWITAGQTADELHVSKYQIEDGHTDGCWYDADGKFIGDGKGVLEVADDAAVANWGDKWVMPTLEQANELFDNTTMEFTELNGVMGCKFTSKTNGNFIFMPVSGTRLNDKLALSGGETGHGYIWTSTLLATHSGFVNFMTFDKNSSGSERSIFSISLIICFILI